MIKKREKYNEAINFLRTWPNAWIKDSVEKIKTYVAGLEETRKLDNQIITQLHETRTELFKIVLADLKEDWNAWSYIGGSIDQFKKDHCVKVSVIEKIIEWDIEEVLRGN